MKKEAMKHFGLVKKQVTQLSTTRKREAPEGGCVKKRISRLLHSGIFRESRSTNSWTLKRGTEHPWWGKKSLTI